MGTTLTIAKIAKSTPDLTHDLVTHREYNDYAFDLYIDHVATVEIKEFSKYSCAGDLLGGYFKTKIDGDLFYQNSLFFDKGDLLGIIAFVDNGFDWGHVTQERRLEIKTFFTLLLEKADFENNYYIAVYM